MVNESVAAASGKLKSVYSFFHFIKKLLDRATNASCEQAKLFQLYSPYEHRCRFLHSTPNISIGGNFLVLSARSSPNDELYLQSEGGTKQSHVSYCGRTVVSVWEFKLLHQYSQEYFFRFGFY